ncbi:Probable aminotransferase/cysteine desulfurase [Mycobacteroides abscessus subsp. abscessus]|nr:Probable aminotransferase/cysteine desulfurase [Mycobacteroides abscessus subsp. abscessus]
MPGCRVLRVFADSSDCVGIVAFTLDGYEPGHVAAYLSAEHGIGVRDGRFCAHPLLARLGRRGALPALRPAVGSGCRWCRRATGRRPRDHPSSAVGRW